MRGKREYSIRESYGESRRGVEAATEEERSLDGNMRRLGRPQLETKVSFERKLLREAGKERAAKEEKRSEGREARQEREVVARDGLERPAGKGVGEAEKKSMKRRLLKLVPVISSLLPNDKPANIAQVPQWSTNGGLSRPKHLVSLGYHPGLLYSKRKKEPFQIELSRSKQNGLMGPSTNHHYLRDGEYTFPLVNQRGKQDRETAVQKVKEAEAANFDSESTRNERIWREKERDYLEREYLAMKVGEARRGGRLVSGQRRKEGPGPTEGPRCESNYGQLKDTDFEVRAFKTR